MGQFTPNIGLYIPSPGESNYDDSFASGMINLDSHDHSGGPNKGVAITSSGLGPSSVTYDKLASNVADPTTGIGVNTTPGLQHQLLLLGILKNLFTLASVPGVGFVSMNGSTVIARTVQDTSTITWTNPDGVAGDPFADLVVPVLVSNGGSGVTSLTPYAPILGGTTGTGPVQQPSVGNAGEVYTSQGAGAPGIFTPLGGLGQIQYSTVTLSANDVRSLNPTAIQIAAAPGAGKILVPIYAYGLLTSDGTAFSTGGGSTIRIRYDTANTAFAFDSNAFITKTVDVYSWATQTSLTTLGGVDKADAQNQPLMLSNTAANYTGGGSSTITIVLAYTTITL